MIDLRLLPKSLEGPHSASLSEAALAQLWESIDSLAFGTNVLFLQVRVNASIIQVVGATTVSWITGSFPRDCADASRLYVNPLCAVSVHHETLENDPSGRRLSLRTDRNDYVNRLDLLAAPHEAYPDWHVFGDLSLALRTALARTRD